MINQAQILREARYFRLPYWAMVDRDDLAQEAYLRAMLGRKSIVGSMQDLSRREGIVKNYRRSHVTKYRRRKLRDRHLSRDVIREEAVLLNRVSAALAALPYRYRLVLHWRYWLGYSGAEIAKRLGVNEPRVVQIHRRALGMIREATGGIR